MLAVLAAVAFFIALFEETLGEVRMVTLGLFLLACHLCYPWSPWVRSRGPVG